MWQKSGSIASWSSAVSMIEVRTIFARYSQCRGLRPRCRRCRSMAGVTAATAATAILPTSVVDLSSATSESLAKHPSCGGAYRLHRTALLPCHFMSKVTLQTKTTRIRASGDKIHLTVGEKHAAQVATWQRCAESFTGDVA